MAKKFEFINREISWLSFNERVLQEAADEKNPLVERMKFLGIFSNNRDEFFRVRVATVKRMVNLGILDSDPQYKNPTRLLNQIQKITLKQQERFHSIYADLLGKLEEKNIYLINEKQVETQHIDFINNYFERKIYPALVPIMLDNVKEFPYLKDKEIYFAVELIKYEAKKRKYAIIEIPTSAVGRFLVLPSIENKSYIMLIDDVIRFCLKEVFKIFEPDEIKAYTIKVTRDAELDLDNDISKSFLEQMKKSLKKRKLGEPVRFVYDSELPEEFLKYFMDKLGMDEDDNLIPGKRYHNFKDFIKFPNVAGKNFQFDKIVQLPVKQLEDEKSMFVAIKKKDVLVHYPYQTFNYFIDLLREAAIDPKVKSIKITIYRLASGSRVVNALINAAKNGKKVTVVIELQARFDEENNIYWSNQLQEEGVSVLHGVAGLKIHSKICMITRKEQNKLVNYCAIGTGNYNENTANLYSDLALYTANSQITSEVSKVFKTIEGKITPYYYKHLVLSPHSLRNKLVRLINTEKRNALAGKPAYIYLKLNSLVDNDLITKLYQAGKAGVKIKLNIRGICSLIAGVPGLSENIEAISILDKFLEHSRVYVFCNGNKPKYYISSADWMVRNLDRRIEVTCPIYDKEIQREIQDFLDIQFSDNVKARQLDKKLSNQYRKIDGQPQIRAQFELYEYYKNKLN